MILARSFLILGVAFAFTVLSSPADAARRKGKKKGGEHVHHGVVESVNHKTGAFTIKSHHHKKRSGGKAMGRRGKGAGKKGGSSGQTFHVTAKTKFQGGSFKSLHKGKHVAVMAQGHRADDVKIGKGKGARPKRKKKAATV